MKNRKMVLVLTITYLVAFTDGFCCSWLLRNRRRFLSWLGLAVVFLVVASSLLASSAYSADQSQTVTLTVIVHNCENQDGHVVARLFTEQQAKTFGFEKDGAQEQIGSIDSSNSSKIVFGKLPVGVYALSVFHDNNDSLKMETNFLGLYKKRFGFSGGATKVDFDAAKISLNHDQVIYITLR